MIYTMNTQPEYMATLTRVTGHVVREYDGHEIAPGEMLLFRYIDPMVKPSRVYIVDDDEIDRQVMARVCKSIRIPCKTATDLSELGPLDAVILDISMPGKSGIEYLADLTTITPVIMYSSIGLTKDLKDSEVGGANAYMVKPSSLSECKEFMRVVKALWF